MRNLSDCAARVLGVVVAMTVATGALAQVPNVPGPTAAATQAGPLSWAGAWTGVIRIGPQAIRFNLRLTGVEGGGGWSGKFDQPDQGIQNISAAEVVVKGETVRVVMVAGSGKPTLEGKVGAEGKVSGTFTQGGAKGSFEMSRGAAERKRRSQEPVPPLPYREEEVRVEVKAGVVLAGTLSIPSGDQPAAGWPGVVLVSGSGPQNRDEELMGHKPFAVLADRLVRAGIVVLRYDDRGVGGSTGDFTGATTKDFAVDAGAAVKWLGGRAEVRKGAAGIIGHSEGGLVGPLVAAEEGNGAGFVVLLAGPGVTGRELLEKQFVRGLEAAGVKPEVIARQSAAQKRSLEAAVKGDEEGLKTAIVDLMLMQVGVVDVSKVPAEMRAKTEAASGPHVAGLKAAWMLQFMALDPREALRKVKVPVLAVNGSLDVQVDTGQNLPEVEKALKEGGNTDVTVREFAGLNHLFQRAKTGAVAEYQGIEETMSEEVMAVVAEWINARFGGSEGEENRR